MRRACPYRSSAAVLLLILLGREVEASAPLGRRHNDPARIHRLDKVQAEVLGRAQITGRPEKRDETCPSDYSLCPASLSGGCCPNRYGCASDACYATTAGTGTACGLKGYYSCGLDDGFGCCPEGYVCGPNDCTAAAGVSNVMTSCPVSYYLCAESFNYGCCQSGLGCAANACYATEPSTFTITETVTTTNADAQTITTTETATTALTPTPPTALPTSPNPNAVAKFIPTKVAKVDSSSVPSNGGGGGLTKAQLGGIIAGAVILLLIVVTLAVIIIRRLNRVANAIDSRRESSDGAGPGRSGQPNVAQYGKLSRSENDASGDDPQSFPGMEGRSGRDRSNSEFSTPYNFPSGNLSDAGSGGQAAYFDIPTRTHNMPGIHHHHHPAAVTNSSARPSIDSQATSALHQSQQYGARPPHDRHLSNASEQSTDSNGAGIGVGSPLIPAELGVEGGFVPELPAAVAPADGRRWSAGTGTAGAAPSPRTSLAQARRRSEGHARGRSEGSASGTGTPGASGGALQLGVVNEAVEFMHGYYGPSDERVGQTATGLDDRPRDSISPGRQ